jgi:hypothetical protein
MKNIILFFYFILIFAACSKFEQKKTIVIESLNTPTVSSTSNNQLKVESNSINKLQPSQIVKKIKAKKAENPKISSQSLSDFANELLKNEGINFTFDNTDFAKKIAEKNKNISEGTKIDNFYNYRFKNLKGQEISFQLPEPEGHPCFAVLDLPILRINDKEIHFINGGEVFQLKRPQDFYTEEFVLVDETLKKSVRKWSTPIDATPFGISEDGKKVYYEYDFADNEYQNELQVDELVIGITENGTIHFASREEEKIIKGKELDGYPVKSEISYRRFKKGNKNYIVKFSYPCT